MFSHLVVWYVGVHAFCEGRAERKENVTWWAMTITYIYATYPLSLTPPDVCNAENSASVTPFRSML